MWENTRKCPQDLITCLIRKITRLPWLLPCRDAGAFEGVMEAAAADLSVQVDGYNKLLWERGRRCQVQCHVEAGGRSWHCGHGRDRVQYNSESAHCPLPNTARAASPLVLVGQEQEPSGQDEPSHVVKMKCKKKCHHYIMTCSCHIQKEAPSTPRTVKQELLEASRSKFRHM